MIIIHPELISSKKIDINKNGYFYTCLIKLNSLEIKRKVIEVRYEESFAKPTFSDEGGFHYSETHPTINISYAGYNIFSQIQMWRLKHTLASLVVHAI